MDGPEVSPPVPFPLPMTKKVEEKIISHVKGVK